MSTLTEALRRELLAARRQGRRDTVSTLRSTLAALANAEAVAVADPPVGASEHVAGAGLGAGSTEAERRTVTHAEQVALVHAEIGELRDAATTYDAVDPDRAAQAREAVRLLERVLAEAPAPGD